MTPRRCLAFVMLLSLAFSGTMFRADAAPGKHRRRLAHDITYLMQTIVNLAGDFTNGRNNDTPGSTIAQNYLINELKRYAVGANASGTGDAAYKQAFTGGTNIVGVIPGGELANEYVIVGAHYDHLGTSCRTADPGDLICNGATDNAAGVANVLAIGRALAKQPHAPRRSVVLAFWDREEDGLVGSRYYAQQQPLVPLAQTVAYVNYDIQGANLLPSLRRETFAVGAESGGTALQDIVRRAARRGPVDTHLVSSIFGQGRSDYVNFTDAGIPTVFFSDSTGPCYHTAQDELDVVDFWKLRFQSRTGLATVQALIEGPRPTFSGSNPLATFDDVLVLQSIVHKAIADLDRFTPPQQQLLLDYRDFVDQVVAEGRANFGSGDMIPLLLRTLDVVTLLTTGACDGFFTSGN